MQFSLSNNGGTKPTYQSCISIHNATCVHVETNFLYLFIFATRPGSPQQREPITVCPYNLTHPVNIPCGKKSTTFVRPLTVCSFQMRTVFESGREVLMITNNINRDYCIVGKCVRFLCKSCERLLNERVSAANE